VTSSGRRPTGSGRRFLNLVLFAATVAVGGASLVLLYHGLHHGKATGSDARPTAAAAAGPHASASSGQSPKPGPKPTALRPDGAMFDDFHYAGGDDPALTAHGWRVRTDSGGPGINDTWRTGGVSFPDVSDARGGKALQLQLTTDGTEAGTRQTELMSARPEFADGTYAARVYFTDGPVLGRNGDHINESFYAIAPPTDKKYSELDYEYMPNGGWGSVRPELDTTSWHSSQQGDRVYHPTYQRLHGWHTVMITALKGRTTYYLDGTEIFTNGAAYSLHGPVDVAFSTWLIDLPFTGKRTWNMQVNWFYYQAGKALSFQDVDKAVNAYYAAGTHYVNTLTTQP